jgi:16S rRNA (adenine1518-N6/adenine1519-N6)-dimethyltransferase
MILPPLNVPDLLRRYGLRPRKSLGQNFLVDSVALRSIVTAAEIDEKSDVLEIGAGVGNLTRYLAAVANRVVALELDPNLLPILHNVMAPFENIRIVHGDILKISPEKLVDKPGYLVVANIPYYITSAVIRHLLEAPMKPGRLVLTMQKEVAKRICAAPGDMSLLALSVQVYGKPVAAVHIPAEAFYPSPKVDSITLRVDLYPQPCIPEDQLGLFFRLAKAGFSQKRKTLRNALSAGMRVTPQTAAEWLANVSIDPMRRAETLSLDEWASLTAIYLQASKDNVKN